MEPERRGGDDRPEPRLTDAEWSGTRADGLEMVAIAGRLQEASGVFIDKAEELELFFTLHRFRVVRRLV